MPKLKIKLNRLALILTTLVYLFFIAIIWPGFIQPDSQSQFQQAIAGNYSDHHPPLMSLLWRWFNKIIPGVGSMYALQLIFMYLSLLVIIRTTSSKKQETRINYLTYPIALLPLLPQVAIYLVTIVKDVQFATSFLLAHCCLAYCTVHKDRVNWLSMSAIFTVLCYGAAVKFQGQYLAIIPATWMAVLLLQHAKLWRRMALAIGLYVLILGFVVGINHQLVPRKSQSNSWQLVKLYDLAAISIDVDKDLIPEANKTERYTWQQLVSKFKYPSVDDYVFGSDSIMQKSSYIRDMHELRRSWRQAILSHPSAYFKHRVINISHTLLSRPGYQYVAPYLQNSKLLNLVVGFMFYLFMSHLPTISLGLSYLCYGLLNYRSKYGQILIGFNATAIGMVAILFSMSMAGTPRYTYLSILLVHASHPFAYLCYSDNRRKFAVSDNAIRYKQIGAQA